MSEDEWLFTGTPRAIAQVHDLRVRHPELLGELVHPHVLRHVAFSLSSSSASRTSGQPSCRPRWCRARPWARTAPERSVEGPSPHGCRRGTAGTAVSKPSRAQPRATTGRRAARRRPDRRPRGRSERAPTCGRMAAAPDAGALRLASIDVTRSGRRHRLAGASRRRRVARRPRPRRRRLVLPAARLVSAAALRRRPLSRRSASAGGLAVRRQLLGGRSTRSGSSRCRRRRATPSRRSRRWRPTRPRRTRRLVELVAPAGSPRRAGSRRGCRCARR